MKERDKKLLELVVENPDIFDVRDRLIKKIFAENGSLYREMSAHIKKKDLLCNISIDYDPPEQKFIEVKTHFYLKEEKNNPYFTIMYNVDDGTKGEFVNNLELLKWEDVKYEGKFKYEIFDSWFKVGWNNKHPVYQLEHKLHEDGFEEEFLDKAKEIFAFVEKALES